MENPHPHLELLPQRQASTPARRRVKRGERGAAVFVVVMAVTLLTAIGLFAAHSATLVDQAAGYARLARQSQHMAEFGTQLATAELGSGAAEAYLQKMSQRDVTCTANAGTTGAPCYVFFKADFAARTNALVGDVLFRDQSGDVIDVIGSHADPSNLTNTVGDVTSEIVVELTEPGPVGVPVAGSDLGNNLSFRYQKVTVTSTAQMRPAGFPTCTEQVASLTGQQSMRAHIIVGPVH
ncbi:MAG TPA: hypothetical protein VFQ61_09375 [Polyangiaceae bacterium]|nr:hypothetical protein [Polyangiaceae bacterium]